MKRIWIISLVIFFLLLLAWSFRWEKGPEQSLSNLKWIHMRDRWTGQAWIALYGVADENVFSGEMKPISSQTDIVNEKEKILAKSGNVRNITEEDAKNTAKLNLAYLAWRNKNIATGIWVSLVAISLISSIVLFVRSFQIKPMKEINACNPPE
jgi:hypothetical protein